MTMKKLIKLSSEYYVIINDSIEIKEGDYCLMFDHFGNLFLGNEPKQYLGKPHGHFLNNALRKVTHSNKPLEQYYGSSDGTVPFVYHKIQQLNLSEVEELVNGYSVEKMAESRFDIKEGINDYEEIYYNGTNVNLAKAYIEGFKAHQELTKEKLFTIEDIINAHYIGWIDRGESETTTYPKAKNNFKQSVLPKSEWLVEFDENGKLKLI